MRAKTVAKVSGWALVVGVVCLWVAVAVSYAGRPDCTEQCHYPYGPSGIYLGAITLTGLAAAGWLLVRGFDGRSASVSTAAAITAKVGRLAAYVSFPLAIVSPFALMIFIGPAAGLAVGLWILAAGASMSSAARELDRMVRSEVVSEAKQWKLALAVTAAFCYAVVATTGGAVV